MSLLKLRAAAELAGISYPTLKQWIYRGKINSVKTAGGHHRVPSDEIERILQIKQPENSLIQPVSPEIAAISGRNKLRGTITELRYAGLLAQVTIDVGGQLMTSIITADAARSLELKKGAIVYALVKATEVMVIRG